MKAAAAVFCAAVLSGALPALAARGPGDADPGRALKAIDTVGHAAAELLKEARDPYAADVRIHADARRFSDGISHEVTVRDFHPYQATSWLPKEYTDPESYTRDGSIEAMERYARAGMEVPPPPVSVKFDGANGERVLRDNLAGAYIYEPKKGPVGIFLNPWMKVCGQLLGDRICGRGVLRHEYQHAIDDAEGRLDPRHVKDGEVSAYGEEHDSLRTGLTPYEISWFMYNFGPNSRLFHPNAEPVPKFIMALLEHFGRVLQCDSGEALKKAVAQVYRDPGERGFVSTLPADPYPG